MKYLGYILERPRLGTKGSGGYYDYMICEGSEPNEVIKNYFSKLGRLESFDLANVRIVSDYEFHYTGYNSKVYFIPLHEGSYQLPKKLMIVQSDTFDYGKIFDVGDYVYFTKTTEELKYHSCMYVPAPTSIPIMRKIISVIENPDRMLYQTAGNGIHFTNQDVGKFVFRTYDEAVKAIERRNLL